LACRLIFTFDIVTHERAPFVVDSAPMSLPRPAPRLLRFSLILLVLLALPGVPGPAAASPQDGYADPPPPNVLSKIDPHLLAQTAGGGQADFLAVLADQADLSGAAALQTKMEKGRYVYHALLAKAQNTQGPLIAWLQAQQAEYQPFYIVNMVWVKGGAGLLQALAARADVAKIEANPAVKGVQSISMLSQAPAPAGIEPNITYVHANQLWSLGFTGQGSVIGSGDTGIQWNHPALKPHYRGWNGSVADHNFNWHDSIHDSVGNACGNDSPAPCDDYGHGTHTMGTAVGDDGGGNQIGAAPGAKWIGCRNMDHGVGTPARYIECFQFFLASYPITGTTSDGNPDLAPDVTTNSWTCPDSEGCHTPDALLAAIQAQLAAGIVTVVAAGNAGPFCSTVHDPPSLYGEAYTVGALNTGSDTIASFSGRGPVTFDGSNRRKPDITAPGNSVLSSIPISGYSNLSGTSMATPHVAGAVALLWSAVPALRGQVTVTEQILNDSAVHLDSTDCGSSGWPNNTFGYGRLDIKAALDRATVLFGGVISGTVTRANLGTPINGAALTVSRGQLAYTTTSSLSGIYNLSVLSGTYTVTVSAFGYLPRVLGNVAVPSGVTTTLPITLTPALLHFFPIIAR
jgi:serine protease AprX